MSDIKNTIVRPPPLNAKSIHHFYDKYASKATKKELSNKILDLKWKVDGVDYDVQYLGRLVEYKDGESFKDEWAKEFVEFVNRLVKKKLIFHGHLAPLTLMDLPSRALDGRAASRTSGKIISLEENIKTPTVVPKSELTHRDMILFYVLSKYTKAELNAILGKKYFTDGGELPELWEAK